MDDYTIPASIFNALTEYQIVRPPSSYSPLIKQSSPQCPFLSPLNTICNYLRIFVAKNWEQGQSRYGVVDIPKETLKDLKRLINVMTETSRQIEEKTAKIGRARSEITRD